MADDTKRPQPEIMPPVPNVKPAPVPPEIPPDKDAPEKNTPVQGMR
jgi:hypothetical protein